MKKSETNKGARARSRDLHSVLPLLIALVGLSVFACSADEDPPGYVPGTGATATSAAAVGTTSGMVTNTVGTAGTGTTGGTATEGAAVTDGATGATGGTLTGGMSGAGGTGTSGTGTNDTGTNDTGTDSTGTSSTGTSGTGIGGGGTGGSGLGDPVETVEFLPNVRVNDNNNGNDVEMSISTGPDGLVLVSWVDGREGIRCGFDVSIDGGMTFGEDLVIRPQSGGITGDAVAGIGADGTLMAVCQDYGISQILLSTSADRGMTWSDPRSIQGAPDKPWIGTSPTEPGVAFLTWLGGDAGVIKTTDSGMTWDRVNDLESLNHGTTISVGSEGHVHIAYTPNGGPIRYLRSTDLGDSWDSVRTIGQTGSFCWSNCGSRQHPIIGGGADPTGQYVAIVWSAELPGGEGDEDIWVIYSSDYGDTWTEPIRANDNDSSSRQWQPWAAVDHAGRVHVTWTDERNDQQDTYYARMSDPDMGFEANVQVNDDSGGVSGNILDYKGIAVQGGDVLVAFPDTRNGGNDVYVAKAPGAAGTMRSPRSSR